MRRILYLILAAVLSGVCPEKPTKSTESTHSPKGKSSTIPTKSQLSPTFALVGNYTDQFGIICTITNTSLIEGNFVSDVVSFNNDKQTFFTSYTYGSSVYFTINYWFSIAENPGSVYFCAYFYNLPTLSAALSVSNGMLGNNLQGANALFGNYLQNGCDGYPFTQLSRIIESSKKGERKKGIGKKSKGKKGIDDVFDEWF